MELHEQLEAVVDEHSFLAFVRALLLDREAEVGKSVDAFGRGENGWENHSIETFLEGALAWAEASNVGAHRDLRTHRFGNGLLPFYIAAKSTNNCRSVRRNGLYLLHRM